jgi:hypothetical protein
MSRFLLVALLLLSTANAADKEQVCQRWAAFGVELQREKNSGIIVNVAPNLEAFKEMVWEFVGTENELRKFIMNDCMGTRT